MRLLQEELEGALADYLKMKNSDPNTKISPSALNYGMAQGFIEKDGEDYYFVGAKGRMKVIVESKKGYWEK